MLRTCCIVFILPQVVAGHSTSNECDDDDDQCHIKGASLLSLDHRVVKSETSKAKSWYRSAPLCQMTLKQGGSEASLKDNPVTSIRCGTPVASEEAEANSSHSGKQVPVPFHFVWIIPDRDCKLGPMEKCSIEAATRDGHTVNLWLHGGDENSTVCDGTPPNVHVRRLVPKAGSHAKRWFDSPENAKAFESLDTEHRTNIIRYALLEQEAGVYLDNDVVISSPKFMASQKEFTSFWYNTPQVNDIIATDFVNTAIMKFDRDSEFLETIWQLLHKEGKERIDAIKEKNVYSAIGPQLVSDVYANRWKAGLPVPPLFPAQSVYPVICEGFKEEFVAVHATTLCGAVAAGNHTGKRVPECSRSFFEGMCPNTMLENNNVNPDGTEKPSMFFYRNSEDARLSDEAKGKWVAKRQAWRRANMR